MSRKLRISEETWRGLTWNRTAKVIAGELGCTVNLVYQAARRYGLPIKPERRGFRSRIDWDRVNWSDPSNRRLATKHGCTREYMRRKRRQHAPVEYGGKRG